MSIRIGYADTESITSTDYLAYAAVGIAIITFAILLIRARRELKR